MPSASSRSRGNSTSRRHQLSPVCNFPVKGVVDALWTFLLAPYDPIVYQTLSAPWSRPDWPLDVPCGALAQVVADCLTGPDRMPEEGEALLEWLQRTKPLWRAFARESRP